MNRDSTCLTWASGGVERVDDPRVLRTLCGHEYDCVDEPNQWVFPTQLVNTLASFFILFPIVFFSSPVPLGPTWSTRQAITACGARSGSWFRAMQVFEQLRLLGLPAGNMSYNTVISALESATQGCEFGTSIAVKSSWG